MELAAHRPTHVYGVIRGSRLAGLRVDVRDSLNRSISLSQAVPDSETGEFGARYHLTPGDRVRAVVVSRQGCADTVRQITRREWRALRADKAQRVYLDLECGGMR
jgi:hypothetical protein